MQLLITIPFVASVKLKTIRILTQNDESRYGMATRPLALSCARARERERERASERDGDGQRDGETESVM